MTVKSIQKVIKIGSSAGVTIPAKDLKKMGVKVGEELEISFKPKTRDSKIGIAKDYEAFAKQYHSALKNLASR